MQRLTAMHRCLVLHPDNMTYARRQFGIDHPAERLPSRDAFYV